MGKKNCIICGKTFNNGIIIKGKGICRNCELNIVKCDINTDFYDYYKKCIRKNIVY